MARKSMNDAPDVGNSKRILESGEYAVEITKVEIKTASTGTPMAHLTLETPEGEVCWDRLAQTEDALGFTKRYLSACGYDMDDLDYEVETKGKKKGQISKYYLTDEDGEEEEYTIEELLLEEEVIITVKAQSKTYKDEASGKEKTRTSPGVDVTSVEPIEDEE